MWTKTQARKEVRRIVSLGFKARALAIGNGYWYVEYL